MKINNLSGFWIFIVLFSTIFMTSCDSDDGQKSCNPEYLISASINVNLPLYSDLNIGGTGWAYVQGAGAGSRGLIVVNTGNGYKAYDRNAPHICPNNESTLVVSEDGLKILCPFDGAEWMLHTGQPLTIADRAPRVYPAVRNGDIINIFN